MKEKQIVLNDLLVNYYFTETRSDAAPTVVFLHGWRSDSRAWNPVFRAMPDYRIFAIDLPGFGRSQTPSGAITLDDYSSVVAEFIRKLNLQPVCLVGHSFGGRVAVKVAVSWPDLVSKLVLADSAGLKVNSPKKKVLTILAKIFHPLFRLPVLKDLRPKIYEAIGAEDYVATPRLTSTFVNVINEDLAPLLPRLRQKTLLVWGENDKETPLKFGELMARQIKDSAMVILKGAGHFSFIDQPQEFVRLLNRFLDVRRD